MDDFYARDPDMEVLPDQEIDAYEDQFYEEPKYRFDFIEELIGFANRYLLRYIIKDDTVWFCLEDAKDAFKFEIPVQALVEGWCKDYVYTEKIDQQEIHYIPAARLLEILEGYWKTCINFAAQLFYSINSQSKVIRCPPKTIEIINTLPI
jgi:hypothetical protein